MTRSFHPYPIVGITKYILVAIFLLLLVFALQDFLGELTLFIILAIMGVSLLMIAFMLATVRFQTLTIGDNSISYERGVLFRKNVVLPYHKITEASYTQDFIQRLFGVGTLNLDTAGGSAMAIHITDIKHSDIEDVLTGIKSKSGTSTGGA